MTMGEYQNMAWRTINKDLSKEELIQHAVYGLNSEAGEVAGLYQKKLQGHPIDKEHLIKEMGDVLWFIAELATANDISMENIGMANIVKLKSRFPDGFEYERSRNRAENDI